MRGAAFLGRARIRALDSLRTDGSSRRILGLVAAMLTIAGLLWFLVVPRTASESGDRWLPWWALGLLFAAAEIYVLHVQVRREARTVSLSDIPLVIGLFLATPGDLVLGRAVLPVLVFVFVRRQPLIKALFNEALLLVEVVAAISVFGLVVGNGSTEGPIGWVGAYAAAGIGGTLSAGFVAVVIAMRDRRSTAHDFVRTLWSGVSMGLLVATPALVAVDALVADSRAAILLVVCTAAVFFAYRAYASLSERHLGLERLYKFSQVVGGSPETDEVLGSLLLEAQSLLRAETAEVSLVAGAAGGGIRFSSTRAGVLRRDRLDDLQTGDWLWARAIDQGEPLLMPRGTRDEAIRRYLDRRGWREAVVVPMRGEAGVVGTLAVADRLGDVRTFDDADAQLLATVANHASVALENGRLIDQLRHEAVHDALTGLPNRIRFRQELSEALAAREGQRLVAAMILDLDGFKEINDTLGHQYGDIVLRELAQRLPTVVGTEGMVARLGGDEFAILLPQVADVADAVAIARRVVRCLEEPAHVDDMNLEIGGSIGLAVAADPGIDDVVLLKRADLAMYAAKSSPTRVAIYEPSLDSSSPQRLALLAQLRQAIQDGALRVHVQPKADVDTRVVSSVEALVRWQHPERGLLPPDEFIPFAERSGLIRPLTAFVLRAAIGAAAQWRRDGREIGIAVNLSARSLLDPDLAVEVEHLLAQHRFPANLLTLEITESSIMSDASRTIGLLDRLHALGVCLSVDDFGTGYSSLSYLKRLPVQEVKIDRTFVATMVSDDSDAAIVRSVVDLGTNLKLLVVAEGVEDERTWQQLADMGCHVAQGFHLSRPMPIEDFPSWLRRYESNDQWPSQTVAALG